MSSDVEIVFNKNQNLLDLGFELIFFFWLCSSKSLEFSDFNSEKYLFLIHVFCFLLQ
jgi:hypothetical protein